jgi:hypothetical protein
MPPATQIAVHDFEAEPPAAGYCSEDSGYDAPVIDDAVIEDAGRRLAEAAGSPARVVLFGSRARGGARDDSDLDFLVIEAQVESKLDEMVRLRDASLPWVFPSMSS